MQKDNNNSNNSNGLDSDELKSRRREAIKHQLKLTKRIIKLKNILKKLRNEHYKWQLVQESCERKMIKVQKLPPRTPRAVKKLKTIEGGGKSSFNTLVKKLANLSKQERDLLFENLNKGRL